MLIKRKQSFAVGERVCRHRLALALFGHGANFQAPPLIITRFELKTIRHAAAVGVSLMIKEARSPKANLLCAALPPCHLLLPRFEDAWLLVVNGPTASPSNWSSGRQNQPSFCQKTSNLMYPSTSSRRITW